MPGTHEVLEEPQGEYPAIVLASAASGLRATFVPAAGMIGSSLTQDGSELLHVGEGLDAWVERGTTFGIPLLHPWANRLAGLSYEAAGVAVLLDPERMPVTSDDLGQPIHGLAHGHTAWTVVRAEAGPGAAILAAQLDVAALPQVLAGFPFPHVLDLVVTLAHAELRFELTLTATGTRSVPVSFGWHPYLRLPRTPRQQWQVTLPVARQALLDARGLPTGQTRPPAFRAGLLADRLFDDLFPLLDDPAEFVVADGPDGLRLRFDDGYPCAQVYSPAGAQFICFEPMTAPTDALRRGVDLRLVAPGESFTAAWSLLVEGRPGRAG